MSSVQNKRAYNPAASLLNPELDPGSFIPAPKLRAKLGISAVTLWRWRNDQASEFPLPKVIKGRLYFRLVEVAAWIERQPGTS